MSPKAADQFARAIYRAYIKHEKKFAVELESEEKAHAVAEAFRRIKDCESVIVKGKRVEVHCR